VAGHIISRQKPNRLVCIYPLQYACQFPSRRALIIDAVDSMERIVKSNFKDTRTVAHQCLLAWSDEIEAVTYLRIPCHYTRCIRLISIVPNFYESDIDAVLGI
jgi:hypothetical protein